MSKEPQPFLRRSTRVYIYSIVVATAPLLAAGGMGNRGCCPTGPPTRGSDSRCHWRLASTEKRLRELSLARHKMHGRPQDSAGLRDVKTPKTSATMRPHPP